jgi:hypothetical protein
VSVRYETRPGNGWGHRRQAAVPVLGMYRPMKQAICGTKTVHLGSDLIGRLEYLHTVRCQCCEACTETVLKNDENRN